MIGCTCVRVCVGMRARARVCVCARAYACVCERVCVCLCLCLWSVCVPPAGQGEAHSTPTLPALMGMGLGGGMFPGFPALANLPVSPARPGKKINHPCRGGRKVFVGQFPRNTTKDDLQQLFEEFGVVEEVFLFKDRCPPTTFGFPLFFFKMVSPAAARLLFLWVGHLGSLGGSISGAKRQRINWH